MRLAVCSAAAAVALFAAVAGTQDAIADGETRTLSFFHTHRRDSATITFRKNGRYDEQALSQLNWFLRDWRTDEPAKMDPRLFDILWEVYRESGSRESINIISAYRSPATNSMLRRRSSGVSEHSQHMLGKAMDIRLPDVDTGRLRAIAMKMQYGGVGYYPSSEFVHVDTGSVRAWPRMSQDQLARLFPNGKTLHLPPSGKPLPGYAEAKAEILPRNAALAAQASMGGSPIGNMMTALLGRKDPPRPAQADQTSKPVAAQVAPASPVIPDTALALAPIPPNRPKDRLLATGIEPPPARPDRMIVAAVAARPPVPSIEPILGPDRKASVRALFDPRTAFLDLGFSSQLENDLSTVRFSGPAVKPLPVKQLQLVHQVNANSSTGS
ncbi:DUF882 domain-containing protein [Microvirga sp. 2TAF3]|uniref:DUF882 domain-containing protein n=1 Tax=Microvirga sp. 2TAF3 TaxID=3233014 RepID=UPI003F95E833